MTCDGDGYLTITANWFHGLRLEDLEKPHRLPVGPFLVPTGTFCWVQTQGALAAGQQMLLVDIHSGSFRLDHTHLSRRPLRIHLLGLLEGRPYLPQQAELMDDGIPSLLSFKVSVLFLFFLLWFLVFCLFFLLGWSFPPFSVTVEFLLFWNFLIVIFFLSCNSSGKKSTRVIHLWQYKYKHGALCLRQPPVRRTRGDVSVKQLWTRSSEWGHAGNPRWEPEPAQAAA